VNLENLFSDAILVSRSQSEKFGKKGVVIMPGYYDENFGWWEIESEEDIEFYHKVQRESVEKECVCCGRLVNLRPDYDKCNSCAEKIERGMDI
jgi:hypothetical protein